jgi:Holliday junction resolvase RusA-like endonuclease
MPDVRLFAAGAPAPKGSRTTGVRRDGTIYTRPASKGEHTWTEAVARVARRHRGRAPAPPYRVELEFAMPKPARPAHPWPTLGDLDKLIRPTLDGLVRGGVLADDRHVLELRASKTWADGEPGVEVVVATAVALAEEAA